MLRRAENVNVFHQPFLLTGKGPFTLQVGKQQYRIGKQRYTKAHFQERLARQRTYPVFWARLNERSYYQFEGRFYWDNDDLTVEQVHALLVTRGQAQQRRIDRAQAIVAIGSDGHTPTQRGHIADDVKQFVWMRDGGKCRTCGTATELQYDHIIPVAMGGSSEQENLQILCGPCNRRKSAGLTMGGKSPSAPSKPKAASQPVSQQLPPAGWFPNPSGEGQRFWDGAAWTEHTHVVAAEQPVADPATAASIESSDKAQQYFEVVFAEFSKAASAILAAHGDGGHSEATLALQTERDKVERLVLQVHGPKSIPHLLSICDEIQAATARLRDAAGRQRL